MELFVGDDWAEEHHDVELMDPAGRRLARARLPEGVTGMARLHAMIAAQLGEGVEDAVVKVGIETDRGPWAQALVAAGYEVFAVNPLQAARYRERYRSPVPRAIRPTRTRWRTWCAPIPTSCVRSRPTARGPRRSRWWPGRIRR